MSQHLLAKPVVEALKNNLMSEVAFCREKGIEPTLGMIRVGQRPDDVYYENSVIKNCTAMGIATKTYPLKEDISMEAFREVLGQVNGDPAVHGILIFRPLPSQLDEKEIKFLINPDKDIDCLSPINLVKIFEGDLSGMVPCTPAAVMETLRHYGIPLAGAKVVVVGRSLVVGKPLSMMLLQENATVTICHSRTKNIPQLTKAADIIVAAIGKGRFIDDQYVSAHSIVIDVGINEMEDGKICGDVNFGLVYGKVQAITPVPGGIGSVTTSILLRQVVAACRKQTGIK